MPKLERSGQRTYTLAKPMGFACNKTNPPRPEVTRTLLVAIPPISDLAVRSWIRVAVWVARSNPPLLAKFIHSTLQLHELRFAVGSRIPADRRDARFKGQVHAVYPSSLWTASLAPHRVSVPFPNTSVTCCLSPHWSPIRYLHCPRFALSRQFRTI